VSLLRRAAKAVMWSGLFLLGFSQPASSQGGHQPRWLIEAPTAGMLPNRTLGLDVRFYGGDGMLAELAASVWGRVLVGTSFGGQGVLGRGDTAWNPSPGVSLRVRVLDETEGRPALAAGFRSQGFGRYDDGVDRYETKSLGVYGAFSKNYRHPLGQGGLHFGLNRSLEDADGDGGLTFYLGVETDLGRRGWLALEHHFARNDGAVASGRGYLNAAIRWTVGGRLGLELDLRNLLENAGATGPDREVRVVYVAPM